VLQHEPHRTIPDFGGKFIRLVHGSILSKVGASSKPGAIQVLTLRVSAKTKRQLEKLAAATNRSKSFLAAEALERYLELEAWQIKEIKQALAEADAGEFALLKDLELKSQGCFTP
jgi:predicted transcriptional regulator